MLVLGLNLGSLLEQFLTREPSFHLPQDRLSLISEVCDWFLSGAWSDVS